MSKREYIEIIPMILGDKYFVVSPRGKIIYAKLIPKPKEVIIENDYYAERIIFGNSNETIR